MLDDQTTLLLEMLAEPRRYENIPEECRDYLGELLERKFVVFFEDHYISLVTDALLESYLRPETGAAAAGSLFPTLSWNMGILRHLSGEGTLSGAGDQPSGDPDWRVGPSLSCSNFKSNFKL
jgi:hypothetical protein